MFWVEESEQTGQTSGQLVPYPYFKTRIEAQELVIKKHFGPYLCVDFKGESKVYNRFASLELPTDKKMSVMSVDLDIQNSLRNFDGTFNLNQVLHRTNHFPALAGFEPQVNWIVSLANQEQITIGNTPDCLIRIQSLPEGMWCKIYSKDNTFFLAPQNGSLFLDLEPVKEIERLEFNSIVSLGESFRFVLVDSLESLEHSAASLATQLPSSFTFSTSQFPKLFSENSLVRPRAISLKPDEPVTVGRDTSNDVVVALPHVSRVHLKVTWITQLDALEFEDLSTNGTVINNKLLTKNKKLLVNLKDPITIDLGKNTRLAIVANEEQYKAIQLVFNTKNSEAVPKIDFREEKGNITSSKVNDRHQKKRLMLIIGIIVLLIIGLIYGIVLYKMP